MYDVIVVGARVAGASTAMLLARRGLKVLAVDRARIGAHFEDGVTAHHVRTVAGASIAVIELRLENPTDQPLHCPPAMTQVHFHDGRVTRRIATHYAPRGAPV